MKKKRILEISMASILCLCANLASAHATQPAPAPEAPAAGKIPLGITVTEAEALVRGWSAKKHLLGKNIVNDKKERIGKIDDLIISPAAGGKMPLASFAIVGVGGFLGMARHDVAIPMEQLRIQDDQLMLPGATKDALKALPKFEYTRK